MHTTKHFKCYCILFRLEWIYFYVHLCWKRFALKNYFFSLEFFFALKLFLLWWNLFYHCVFNPKRSSQQRWMQMLFTLRFNEIITLPKCTKTIVCRFGKSFFLLNIIFVHSWCRRWHHNINRCATNVEKKRMQPNSIPEAKAYLAVDLQDPTANSVECDLLGANDEMY